MASFFSIGRRDYMIVGVEEDTDSKRHNGHYNLVLDHGVAYAPHLFRDAEGRLIQLGWADETAKQHIVKSQGWTGCLTRPRELYEISKPITDAGRSNDIWNINDQSGMMTTLGIRPAHKLWL